MASSFLYLEGLHGSSVSGALAATNTILTPRSLTGLVAITPAGVARELLYVKSSGGAVVNTVNPQILAGTTDGQEIVLVGTSNTDTIELNSGHGLNLNGNALLKSGSMILLLWNQAVWLEMARNDL